MLKSLTIHENSTTVKYICPMCGRLHEMEIDCPENVTKYFFGDMLIQDAFPGLNATEREFVKSGYCPDCQQLLFGNSDTDKIVRSF